MEEWLKMYRKAKKLETEAHKLLQVSVRELARMKGFSNEQVEQFAVSFATGGETVVSFNQSCEMADLDMLEMANMSKEDIVKRLLNNPYGVVTHESEDTVELLIK